MLVVDETRRTGGVSEGVVASLVDAGFGGGSRGGKQGLVHPARDASALVLLSEAERSRRRRSPVVRGGAEVAPPPAPPGLRLAGEAEEVGRRWRGRRSDPPPHDRLRERRAHFVADRREPRLLADEDAIRVRELPPRLPDAPVGLLEQDERRDFRRRPPRVGGEERSRCRRAFAAPEQRVVQGGA